MPQQRQPYILISGNGVAAGILACLLRGSGIRVAIASPQSTRPRPPVIEALSPAAAHLIGDIGLAPVLDAAGSVTVAGFVNRFHDETQMSKGPWTHVERATLANELLAMAEQRGATRACADDATSRDVFALVDASGRAARWSRPVRRARPAMTTVFTGPGEADPEPGLVARAGDGWVYRLAHPAATTVGVVNATAINVALDAETAATVGVVDSGAYRRIEVRPSAVQWSLRPVRRRLIAIGDAALALNPIAGQGLRFAVASAMAAEAVIRTWLAGDGGPHVFDYYREFVDGARRRHFTALREILDEDYSTDSGDGAVALDPRSLLWFTGTATHTGLRRDGHVVADEAFRLADGGLVRFYAGVDLAWCRDAATTGAAVTDVCAALRAHHVPTQTALAAIMWALKHGVLSQRSM